MAVDLRVAEVSEHLSSLMGVVRRAGGLREVSRAAYLISDPNLFKPKVEVLGGSKPPGTGKGAQEAAGTKIHADVTHHGGKGLSCCFATKQWQSDLKWK